MLFLLTLFVVNVLFLCVCESDKTVVDMRYMLSAGADIVLLKLKWNCRCILCLRLALDYCMCY